MRRPLDVAPTFWRDIFECAVYEYGLGIGIPFGQLVPGRTGQGRIFSCSYEMAIYKDVAVIGLGIAYPHKGPGAFQQTIFEIRRPSSQNHITAAFDDTTFEIDRPVDLQGVARPDNPYVAQVVAGTHEQKAFGLSVKVGLYGHVFETHIVAVIGGKGCSAGRESSRPFIRFYIDGVGVECFIVGVMYQYAVSIFPLKKNVFFISEVDQVFIVPVVDKNAPRLRTEIGYEIHCSLYGTEVSAPVMVYDKVVSGGFRCVFTGAESPCLTIVNAGELSFFRGENFFVDGYVVTFPVFQQIVVRIDGSTIAVDDNRIKVKSVGKTSYDCQLIRSGRIAYSCARWSPGLCVGVGNGVRRAVRIRSVV